MKNFIKMVVSLIFPSKCIVCGKEGNFICSKDLQNIPRANKPSKDWIISVWNYKDPNIKKVLWMLKFEHKFAVMDDMEEFLFDYLFEELGELAIFENNQNYILVPIPLSKKSLRVRGYNQSEIIAKALSRKSENKLQIETILKKTMETKAQHSIKNKNERLKNLRGVFKVKENTDLKGKNLILIDDITTTHGTLIEARRTLLASGARSVLAFTIAH